MDMALKAQWLSKIDRAILAGPYDATWESLERHPSPVWYEDAKFGIFIHWGLYCVPAFQNEWYPRNMYIEGSKAYEHHRKTYGPQSKFGYKDFIPMFKAEKFDPAEWAAFFRECGAKYVMPVAEHHDGFQMYDSELSRWNAKQMGPCRDIVGELADALRKEGLVFTASSHRAEHYWYMGNGRYFDSDVNDPACEDFYGPAQNPPCIAGEWEHYFTSKPSVEHLENWLIRTCEIIDKYRPQVMWFDYWIMNMAFKPYLKKMAAYYYNRAAEWGLEVSINYKYDAFPPGVGTFDVERGQLSNSRLLFWQTDTAVAKNSWGYTENNNYKEATDILCDLMDIVSKNGALLLNIGPKADGTIPEGDRAILSEIGKWLAVNGEAVYGTRPWAVFGEGPTAVTEGAFTDTKRNAFTQEDVRYTRRGDTVYATILKAPEAGRHTLKAFADVKLGGKTRFLMQPARVSALCTGESLNAGVCGEGLWVETPDLSRCNGPVVLKIELPQGGNAAMAEI